MKTDVAGCSVTAPGTEHWEWYTSQVGYRMVQYDYRTSMGRLFSCVALSLEVARARRVAWERFRLRGSVSRQVSLSQ